MVRIEDGTLAQYLTYGLQVAGLGLLLLAARERACTPATTASACAQPLLANLLRCSVSLRMSKRTSRIVPDANRGVR